MGRIITAILLISMILTSTAGSCDPNPCPPGQHQTWHCSETARTCWTVCVDD